MRILIISTYFPPQNSIGSLRPYSWAKYWTLMGHDVTVVTTEKTSQPDDLTYENPGYKIIEVPLPYFLRKLRTSLSPKKDQDQPYGFFARVKGEIIKYLTNFRISRGIFYATRMPDLTSSWVNPALNAIKDHPTWDLTVSTFAPYTTHLVGLKLKQQNKTKSWIADFRDPWTNGLLYKGLFPFTLIEKSLEKKIVNNADALTTVSKELIDDYKDLYPHKTFNLITNGFDCDDLTTLDPSSPFPNDNKYRLLYTGSIYPGKQNIIPLFEGLKILKDDSFLKDFEFTYVGNQYHYIEELTTQFDLHNIVNVSPPVSRTTILKMQRDANALLFLPWTDEKRDGVLTGKIYEYLFSRTPILCVGAEKLESAQKLILDAKAGITLPTKSDVISFLTNEVPLRKKVPTKLPEEYKKQFSRKFLAERMLNLPIDMKHTNELDFPLPKPTTN